MTIRTAVSITLLCTTLGINACGIKSSVPDFEYPEYTKEKEWPELVPTSELQSASDVDVEKTIEEIEELKRLAEQSPS